jgi:hypothetical protein
MTCQPFGTSCLLQTLKGLHRPVPEGGRATPMPPRKFMVCRLDGLRARAGQRLPGYLEECLRRGHLDGGTQTVTFTMGDWIALRQMFNKSLKTGTAQIISPRGCCG